MTYTNYVEELEKALEEVESAWNDLIEYIEEPLFKILDFLAKLLENKGGR